MNVTPEPVLRGHKAISAYLGKSRSQTTILAEAGHLKRWTDEQGRTCVTVADADACLKRDVGALVSDRVLSIQSWENEGGLST